MKKIFIYCDTGVSNNKSEIFSFVDDYKGSYEAHYIDAEEIKTGLWRTSAACFIVPGGADRFYSNKLNGMGNREIKSFVHDGGLYIGICAGSYYAGKEICFDLNGPLEIVAERELAFFPGKVIGPLLSRYEYNSTSGARIAKIKLTSVEQELQPINVYYNGGGYFANAEKFNQVNIIATYQNKGFENMAAIIECSVGKGKAILSAVHPEISVNYFANNNIEVATSITTALSDEKHLLILKLLLDSCL